MRARKGKEMIEIYLEVRLSSDSDDDDGRTARLEFHTVVTGCYDLEVGDTRTVILHFLAGGLREEGRSRTHPTTLLRGCTFCFEGFTRSPSFLPSWVV